MGRLSCLPVTGRLPDGLEVRRATKFVARLRGLAGLAQLPAGSALLLERTRSVHTFGMRFDLDLVWLRDGRVLRIDRCVPPRRMRSCRQASAVLELAAGDAECCGLEPGAVGLPGPGR